MGDHGQRRASHRKADVWLIMMAGVVGLLGGFALLNIPPANAHFDDSGRYSHSTSDCTSSTNRRDPVMNVYYNNATPTNVGTHVQHHTGWTNQEGSPQWYKTHADPVVCDDNLTTSQRASNCGSCDRIHTRFKLTHHGDLVWGTTSLGTPHHEEWVYFNGCGATGAHAVFEPYGFQNGRTAIWNALVGGGHPSAQTVNWGNTQQAQQCDGAWVGSVDGLVDFIDIP